MNATECCKTIGCNCGGTTSAEAFRSFSNWIPSILLIAGCCLVLFIILKLMENRR